MSSGPDVSPPKKPESVREEAKPGEAQQAQAQPSWGLFAARANKIESTVKKLEQRSLTPRVVRAARLEAARVTNELTRKATAASEIAAAAGEIANKAVEDLGKRRMAGSYTVAQAAVRAAQKHFTDMQMDWTEEHTSHVTEISQKVAEKAQEAQEVSPLDAEAFATDANSMAATVIGDTEKAKAAATTLAEKIAAALGGE
jgi:HD-GYP domain-containing protein (c-di-GMP phosphodiesterase class II)